MGSTRPPAAARERAGGAARPLGPAGLHRQHVDGTMGVRRGRRGLRGCLASKLEPLVFQALTCWEIKRQQKASDSRLDWLGPSVLFLHEEAAKKTPPLVASGLRNADFGGVA